MKLLIFVLFVSVSQQQSQEKSMEVFSLNESTNEMEARHILKKPLKIHRLRNNEKRKIYHYEQTFVIRDVDLNDKVKRCELIEVYYEYEIEQLTNILNKLLKKSIEEIDMKKMMYLLKDCDSVDDLLVVTDNSINGINDIFTMDWTIPSYSFRNGIYPGTKWCGFGDVASSYHDLAELRNVDRCCRAHDFCPIKVLGYDKRYNLTNAALHSKSHCLCDEAFYDCLIENNSWTASFLGHLYFYAASPECISGLPETKMEFVSATKKWYKK